MSMSKKAAQDLSKRLVSFFRLQLPRGRVWQSGTPGPNVAYNGKDCKPAHDALPQRQLDADELDVELAQALVCVSDEFPRKDERLFV